MANEPGRESHDVTELCEAERAVGQRLQDQLAVACGEGDETAPGLVRVLECRGGGVVTLRAEDPGEVEREPVGYRESCEKHWLTILFDSDRAGKWIVAHMPPKQQISGPGRRPTRTPLRVGLTAAVYVNCRPCDSDPADAESARPVGRPDTAKTTIAVTEAAAICQNDAPTNARIAQ